MTSIGSNIASSSGVSSEGPLVPTWVSLTLEEHLQNFKHTILKGNRFSYQDCFSDKFWKSIAKVIEALRMDPCGDIDHLLLCIHGPQPPSFFGSTPLHWAVWMDDRVMVHYILDSGKVNINAPNIQHRSALCCAFNCGNPEIVEDLLEYCKANVFTDQALENMVREKSSMFGILKRILTDNVNACDEAKKTALHHASKIGFTDVVAYLLNEKADVNLKDKDGYTPLHCASNIWCLNVVKLLLQQNADVNAISGFGKSPLHLAAREGATHIVSLLVDHNAVVDALDNKEWTPLLYSLVHGEVDTSKALIAAGANVHIQDKNGNNALHLAILALVKNMDIVKLLRECDVNANAKNSKGRSPFFIAVVKGHTKVVKELLLNKEKIKPMEECNGETAIQIAFDRGHEHIKRALLEFDDVSRYVETLYRNRQVYVDAANAILVGIALIASVTFASWLQPPLGYTTSYLNLAPSSSNINYVDVQYNLSL